MCHIRHRSSRVLCNANLRLLGLAESFTFPGKLPPHKILPSKLDEIGNRSSWQNIFLVDWEVYTLRMGTVAAVEIRTPKKGLGPNAAQTTDFLLEDLHNCS
ncbi:hypothetical protein K435DRAFT_792718 [Dendrothele bispora CBS 962.96]|uniref:Uncharacterized protein n=1 Tax=Dendrothele bispora (strain CBS 962.96) TaxID=1314807 RepID=A0A4S8MI08_DENBC|nr:hypothetical protein K435DRAFT_792718 [Dendrothele bispora CBS 962.96]